METTGEVARHTLPRTIRRTETLRGAVGSLTVSMRPSSSTSRRGALVTALLVSACLGAPGASHAAPAAKLVLRLPSHATENHPRGLGRPVAGQATVLIPAGWTRTRSTHAQTNSHLLYTLSPSCRAKIEINTWVGRLETRPTLEIERAMDFWYSVFAPERPVPLPLVAHRSTHNRIWALSVPRPPAAEEPARPRISPFYGVLLVRLPQAGYWASISLGVRTTVACTNALPDRAALEDAIEGVLETTSFKAHFGEA
jgi:hypothetical protein